MAKRMPRISITSRGIAEVREHAEEMDDMEPEFVADLLVILARRAAVSPDMGLIWDAIDDLDSDPDRANRSQYDVQYGQYGRGKTGQNYIGVVSPDLDEQTYLLFVHDLPGLRECRKAAGYTLQALAERVGLSTEGVRRLEVGGSTREETAARLAAALGVSVAELRIDPTETRAGREE